MKSYFVLANDIIIEFKGLHLSQCPGETQLGFKRWKLKAAHPVNYFPGFLGKIIKILIYLPGSKYSSLNVPVLSCIGTYTNIAQF